MQRTKALQTQREEERAEKPPIPGEADTERGSRIDAERVTLQFGARSNKRLDGGKKPITESPLFGGESQAQLF